MKISPFFISLGSAISLLSCGKPDKVEADLPESISISTKESSSAETRKAWPPASDHVDPDLLQENYLVVLDDSGSMKGEKIEQAKSALLSLAQTLPQEHNLGLVRLNRSGIVSLGLGSREDFVKTVKSTQADGGTPLRAVTTKAYQLLTKKASSQRGYGTYHMIIVTDGESSDGSAMPLVEAIVVRTSIQVHVIGFHLQNHEMNQPHLVDYQTAGNSQELTQAFEAVAAETEEFTDPQKFSR